MRILSKKCVLWTEMVVDETIIHSETPDYHLKYEPDSHPIVCQIGGNSPDTIDPATRMVLEQYEYDEININMDCPSNRGELAASFLDVSVGLLLRRLELIVLLFFSLQWRVCVNLGLC